MHPPACHRLCARNSAEMPMMDTDSPSFSSKSAHSLRVTGRGRCLRQGGAPAQSPLQSLAALTIRCSSQRIPSQPAVRHAKAQMHLHSIHLCQAQPHRASKRSLQFLAPLDPSTRLRAHPSLRSASNVWPPLLFTMNTSGLNAIGSSPRHSKPIMGTNCTGPGQRHSLLDTATRRPTAAIRWHGMHVQARF